MAKVRKSDNGTRTRAAAPRPERHAPERTEDNSARIKKLAIRLGLVLAAVLLIALFWRNRVDWSFSNIAQCASDAPAMSGTGGGFPATVSGGGITQIDELADGVAVLSDTSFTVYNSSSKEAASRAHFMSSPAMNAAGRYAVLIDVGGKHYRLETISKTLVNGTTDNNLLSCAASRNGRFALVMQGGAQSSGMISTVEVYDRNGEWLHRWSSSDCYVTGAALSADGKYLAMCGLSAKGGIFESVVIVQKVGAEGDLARYTRSDNVYFSLGYTSTGTLFAIGSKVVLSVSDYSGESSEYALDGEPAAADIDYDSGAAVYTTQVAESDSGSLVVFDTYGQVRYKNDIPLYGVAVSLSESGCCVLGRGELRGYRLDGGLLGTWDAGATVSGCVMMGRTVYACDGVSVSKTAMRQQDEN